MVKHIAEGNISVTDNPNLPYKIIRPDSRDSWLEQRKLGVGASECGKLVGCSKYGNAYSLFIDKIGLGKKVEENWAMKQGHIFEREVAEIFQATMGFKVIGLHQFTNVKADWLACSREQEYLRVSPDYIYWLKDEKTGKDLRHNIYNRGILECKTSVHHYTPDCLKDECLSWYCQVQYQLHVLGLKHAYLGFLCVDSLTGGESWFHPIEYNEKFCKETLIPAISEFWSHHVMPAMDIMKLNKVKDADDISPELMEQIMEYAPKVTDAEDVSKRWPKQDEGKVIEGEKLNIRNGLLGETLNEYIQLRNQQKQIESSMKEIEDAIKLLMEDADSITLDGKAVVTFRQNKATVKFDAKKFKEENADMYNKYCVTSAGSRVFKIK